MLTRTADEVPIWWEQIGAGPAVVLLPGRGDSSDLFPSILVDRLLSAGLSVIRMDPRDTGLSDDGGDEYTLSTLADDVVAVLGAAEVDRAHIEAVSMGGMITVDLVSRFPDRVLSSVFIAAMSPDPEGGIGPDFFTPLEGASPAEMILALMSSPNETKTGTGWTRSSIEVGAGRRRDRKTGSVTWRRHSGSAGAPLLTYSLTSKSPPYSDDRWNPPDHTHRWLHGQWRIDPKTTSSVYATARDAVWPWGNPMVRASAATCEIDLDWLTSGSNTMYLCAPLGDRKLGLVFSALLQDLIEQAFTRANTDGPLKPSVLVCIDETANTPIPKLAEWSSTVTGTGTQLVTVWQLKAQLDEIYGRHADTVLTNHRTKLISPSSLSNMSTADYISHLVGDEHVRGEIEEGRLLAASDHRPADRHASKQHAVSTAQRPPPSPPGRRAAHPRQPTAGLAAAQ